MGTPRYSRESLLDMVPDPAFRAYRKVALTVACRHEGPFECLTSEGNLARCEDGYLAVDQHGHPYPVNREEFEKAYEPVGPLS